MAKINHEKRNQYDKIDHYHWAKERRKIQDKKWKLFKLENPKEIKVNLGIHEKHNWQVKKGPFGPHSGKIICNDCEGKFVAWLPKGF